jgi:FkbM family methyltransferase
MQSRVKLTSQCKDCINIPKVENAGKICAEDNKKIQYMFNGIKIYYDSYHSPWVNEIISNLKGHHEPQEELCFYHIVNLLDNDANMLELGCAWAYYSMFFKNKCKDGINICIEPNSKKLDKGISNIKLNNFDMNKFIFMNGFIGKNFKSTDTFIDWDKTEMTIPQYNIEKIVKDANIFFDIIHSDIQGSELDMLIGSINVLNNIGFFVISTHDNKHPLCLQFLEKNNFLVLVQHTISESVSADGLIIAINKQYISKYEKNIEGSLRDYFNNNCKITKV